MRTTDGLAGKNVMVMGLGRFGGGIGVSRWLAGQGAKVTVTDKDPADKLAESVRQLDGLPITFKLGGHEVGDLDGIDLLVVSPAVDKNKSDFFKAAQTRGIPWTSETNLFLERCKGQIIAITGSVGKSTTTAMIGGVLQAAFAGEADAPRVLVGGNIGKSLLDELPDIRAKDIVILEISSFQLEDVAAIRVGPTHVVLTNLQPNHLDRHGTFDAYIDAKMNAVRFLREHGSICFNGDDPELCRRLSIVRPENVDAGYKRPVSYDDRKAWVHVEDGAIVAFREKPEASPANRPKDRVGGFEPVIRLTEMGVPGRHNVYNAMLAINIGLLYGASDEAMAGALRNFRGLPHRLEYVAEVGGVKYFNDSKCTTPESAMTAIDAFDVPVVSIVGGYDKGSPFEAMGKMLAGRARAVVCLGVTAPKIEAEVRKYATGDKPAIRLVDSFEAAVAAARELARPGDVVLMSPACASWDMFTNYEQRGDLFKKIVLSWK